VRARLAALLLLFALPAHATVTAQISNAPIWQPSTSYSPAVAPARFGSRVNSGPGTIGGSYSDGSAVYAWAALNSGTSASSGNGPQTCGTPGTTTFTESTGLQWLCLGLIDYVTFSSWAHDAPAYATGTYLWHDYVRSSGNLYRADQVSGTSCTASGAGPSGTSNGQTIGNCTFDWVAASPYQSGNNGPIPHQTYPSGSGAGGTANLSQGYTGVFFHGGTAAPEYIAGSGNEPAILVIQAHVDFTNDTGQSNENTPINWVDGGNPITVTCAPVDCLTSGTPPPVKYDNTQLVSFRNSANVAGSTWNISVPSGTNSYNANTGIDQEDSNVYFVGVEVKSDHGCGICGNRPNGSYFHNLIVDANGAIGVYTDSSSMAINLVVVNRTSLTGAFGFRSSYPPAVDNVTIYMPNAGTNASCIGLDQANNIGKFGPQLANPYWSNILTFGCPNWGAVGTATVANVTGGANQFGNAGDMANTSSSPVFTGANIGSAGGAGNFTGIAPLGMSGSNCGGPCYSLTFGNVFVSTSDLTEKNGSPTIGAGATFSLTPGSPFPVLTNATDLFGTTRPTGTKYDPGAFQVGGVVPVLLCCMGH
jgi:hypothetical protein